MTQKSNRKLYYSFVERDGYTGDAPDFFDPEDFEWSRKLEQNWKEIRSELECFLAEGKELWPYFDQGIVSKKNSWKTIPFAAWGVHFRKNQRSAPKTMELLNSIPGMVSASFNLLEKQSDIVPHFGDTDGIFRCHLGIVIPGELPEVGFKVNEKSKSWEEGKLLMFCDAHLHTAWNHSDSNRFILLFDVIRPEFLHRKRTICSKVLASLYLQSLAAKLPFLKKLPIIVQFLIYKLAITSARIAVPIRNFFSKIFVS